MKININKVIKAIQADGLLLEEDEARLLLEANALKERIEKAEKAKKMFPGTEAYDKAEAQIYEAEVELRYFVMELYLNFDILV